MPVMIIKEGAFSNKVIRKVFQMGLYLSKDLKDLRKYTAMEKRE